mmetsp:Transcript_38818/g.91294  ORF Transcript_38818/g.91294 Transcript_38818/m.91294 type:complete len:318 (-) Transcript_38818:174-1127(-)
MPARNRHERISHTIRRHCALCCQNRSIWVPRHLRQLERLGLCKIEGALDHFEVVVPSREGCNEALHAQVLRIRWPQWIKRGCDSIPSNATACNFTLQVREGLLHPSVDLIHTHTLRPGFKLRAVQQQDIDALQLKSGQTLSDLLSDPRRINAVPGIFAHLGHPFETFYRCQPLADYVPDFAHHHNLFPSKSPGLAHLSQYCPDCPLSISFHVVGRNVHNIDSSTECQGKSLPALLSVIQVVAPKTYGRYPQSRSTQDFATSLQQAAGCHEGGGGLRSCSAPQTRWSLSLCAALRQRVAMRGSSVGRRPMPQVLPQHC